MKGIRGGVTFTPRGLRDVYWCCNLNEPVIIEYRNKHPYCVNCSWEDKEATEQPNPSKYMKGRKWQKPSSTFLDRHVFICGILKVLQ